METEGSCQCSINALQTLTELRNVHTVVELGTILDLVHRVYSQGQVMLQCKECRQAPSSSMVTIPALAEQCLSLFEAVCLAYSITRQNTLFDPNALAFEQPLPQFICIRSKVQLGETEMDEDDSGVLVRMLLSRNLIKLVELLKALREVLRSLSKETPPSHRTGPLRACESSVESTIRRFAVFMEQIELDPMC
ncbi:uncharacterized protein ATNIH1004_004191 [Aspergillus tanneri]|uniref:AflR-like C6 transcription factor n=1 Tax=Aspergillus tanneri TaxID=1220188 RepID=A0A5M9MQW3_9EURO|nr:uncharacterized protein ATNIH1004_004191 [Aspergillus tanneri]KAA8648306.1 hypothetical protein ATNIH1004_004191 [Aspergillus tanneri]